MAEKKKGYQLGKRIRGQGAAAKARGMVAARRRKRDKRIKFEGYGSAYDRLSGDRSDRPRPATGKGGGWVEGGTIESFNTQVNRKYGGGGSVKKKSDDGTTYARGSGAARPQIFRKNG